MKLELTFDEVFMILHCVGDKAQDLVKMIEAPDSNPDKDKANEILKERCQVCVNILEKVNSLLKI
jgi:hypothetical protein